MSRPELELTPNRSALHRFGYELRSWRKARHLSQDRLGKQVHVSGDTVGLIETAKRRPSRDFAERCDRALDTMGALTRQWEVIEAERAAGRDTAAVTDTSVVGTDRLPTQRVASDAGDRIVVQMTSLSGEPVSVAIDRRTFLSGVAALPAVAWLAPGALGPGALPRPVSDGGLADVIRNMTQLRTILAAQDNVLGPGAVAATAVQQLDILQRLSRTASGQARESLMRLQAAYAEFTGWLADDLGDLRTGQYWTDRALEWSHEADDELIVGYVLMRKAQRAADANDPAATIGLAQAAQRRGALTPRVRAAAAQYEAQGHALDGNHEAFRDAIERARGLVVAAPPVVAGEWAVWCTSAYVDIHEAAGWMRIGDPAQAADGYERALADWSAEFQRDEGLYRSRQAHAYAAAGIPEQAAETGRNALQIASQTGSARIVAELAPLPAALRPWQQLPAVRTFTAELVQAQTPATATNGTDLA